MNQRALWVVEWFIEENQEWTATAAFGFSRAEGRSKLRTWLKNNTDDKARLVRYEPVQESIPSVLRRMQRGSAR